MKLSSVVLLAAVVSSANAFTAHPRSFVTKTTTALNAYEPPESSAGAPEGDEEPPLPFAAAEATTATKPSKIDGDGNAPMPDMEAILSKIPKVDFSALTSGAGGDLGAIQENVFGGTLGERGEAYFGAQVVVLLSICFGGIPVVGDVVMLLLGPVLTLAGLAVVAISVKDLGNALSPWTAPTKAGLIETGLYGKLRHPMYAGLLAACAGLSIVTGSSVRLLLTALLWYVIDVKVTAEEQAFLESPTMGSAYAEYMMNVPGKYFPQEILDEMPWNKDDSGAP